MVGFNAKNLDCIESFYICNFCSLVLRKPVQLIDYGHRLCQSCANEQTGKLIRCSEHCEKAPRENNHLDQNHPNPQCDSCSLNFNSVNDLDRHKLYDCEKITVHCPLKSIGCEEMIPRIHLSQHYLSDQHQNSNSFGQISSEEF
ncbi:unnamed protein product [Rotaria magnacalcarata]|uniref:TRAF-type domain-containing protein n=1 Tax=Rotaria magnacalcarata TaxID=392030 RepID=A0A816TXB7_9BILA|nr:unnamed protein product [Rotaria magnacalcarata]